MKLSKDFLLKLMRKKSGFLAALIIQIKIKFCLLHVISKALDDWSKKYDNVVLLGDFNNEPEEKNVKFPKHLLFEKHCQTKDLFQKPR